MKKHLTMLTFALWISLICCATDQSTIQTPKVTVTPTFSLTDFRGKTIALDDFKGRNVVLVFYVNVG